MLLDSSLQNSGYLCSPLRRLRCSWGWGLGLRLGQWLFLTCQDPKSQSPAPVKATSTGENMKVGVLGSGDVAKALGSGFLKHGHDVMLGTRETSKLADWLAANSGARGGSFAEAAEFADLIVLAVKGT